MEESKKFTILETLYPSPQKWMVSQKNVLKQNAAVYCKFSNETSWYILKDPDEI